MIISSGWFIYKIVQDYQNANLWAPVPSLMYIQTLPEQEEK